MPRRQRTKAEQAAREAVNGLRASNLARQREALSDDDKVHLLGNAIARTVMERGSFDENDARVAGFTDAERKKFYEPAFAYAQTLEPELLNRAVA